VATFSDICDQRYRNELDIGTSDIGLKRAESDNISDIGMNFHPISDIRRPDVHKSAQWLRGKPLACDNNGLRFKISRSEKYFWISDIGKWTQMSILELFRCRNDSCGPTHFLPISELQMSMSDIADIKIDADAHLCLGVGW
jgi:hypothetical protein